VVGYFWGGVQYGYTLFGIKNGKVAVSFSIHAQISEAEIGTVFNVYSGTDNIYSYIRSDYIPGRPSEWENADFSHITKGEFYDMIERYSLAWENRIWWGDVEDETERILAMTLDEKAPKTTKLTEFIVLNETTGLTSANVRFYYANCETLLRTPYYGMIPHYLIFDWNRFGGHHKFYNYEYINEWNLLREGTELEWTEPIQLAFTTETTVKNFRFLEIAMNEDFWSANEHEQANKHKNTRAYDVQNVLYTFDELMPQIPFVVVGVNTGGLFAKSGFSFVDDKGATRYFAIYFAYGYGDPVVRLLEF
jgi:hypothetical protein